MSFIAEARHPQRVTFNFALLVSRSSPSRTPHRVAMALLVDKHRPRSLDTLTYHHDLSDRLRSLVHTPSAQTQSQADTIL